MTILQQRFLWADNQGVLRLTIGGVKNGAGHGWMDQAVLFCPFCGTRLQTKEEIRSKAESASPNVQ